MQPFASRVHAPLRAALLDLLGPMAGSPEFARGARNMPTLTVEDVTVEDWASLTFEGQKHRIELRLDGEQAVVEAAGAVFAAALGDVEFTIPGQIVADIALTSTAMVTGGGLASRRLRFEVLTIDD